MESTSAAKNRRNQKARDFKMVKRRSLKVAEIGAGVAGLTAARSLLSEGNHSDPTGLDPHGSLYHSLRTNLPRPLLGFSDYPFPAGPPSGAFPSHNEVLSFIEGFARDFGLSERVRFGSEMGGSDLFTRLGPLGFMTSLSIHKLTEESIQGYAYHNPLLGQTVVLIGSAASAHDISREISVVAKEVYLSSRSADEEFSKVGKGKVTYGSTHRYDLLVQACNIYTFFN
ncbi:Flavin-containing monooxygenase FMO GS-OX2 [Acorus gramineus]|uniref:Flavin-containing monooxygenase FMO GS-OX2 n=1 Tax=Acorus gramineus TaxID=55184 RepID=A0AAV9B9B1_ACOGR|nr:Flavin-containing monooxygenase FMO GS-OX2 [Acorus gramineus]